MFAVIQSFLWEVYNLWVRGQIKPRVVASVARDIQVNSRPKDEDEIRQVQLWKGRPCLLLPGSGNPLQYSCLENPMDGGAW